MAVVGPDNTRTPDYMNPAAIRYARQMLMKLVKQGLIQNLQSATSHYGGDPTAAWRALSGLTGAPHTTTMQGAGPDQSQYAAPPGPAPTAQAMHAMPEQAPAAYASPTIPNPAIQTISIPALDAHQARQNVYASFARRRRQIQPRFQVL